MPMKVASLTLALGVVALALPSGTALAQDGAGPVVIEEVTCRDLLLQMGAEQERTISFLHGYAAGAAERAEVDPDALATATSRLMEACIEDPDSGALAMLRDVLG
jgi:hypothetical protein